MEELQRFNAGYGFLDEVGERPFEYDGVVIPELENLFIAFSGGRIILEIKDEGTFAAERLCDMIKEYEAEKTTMIASYHQDAMEAFRVACPTVTTSMTIAEVKNFIAWQRMGLSNLAPVPDGAKVMAIPNDFDGEVIITDRLVDAAHSRGLAVQAWTINDFELMKHLKSLGVDGIYTDFPAAAKEALK